MDKNAQSKSSLNAMFSTLVIIISIGVAFLIYFFIMGDPSHFVEGNTENHPIKGDYLGIIYKGGIIVPFLMGMMIMAITFSIERLLTISKAKGKGSVSNFVRNIKLKLSSGNIDAAIAECDQQRGSLANVVKAALLRYKQLENEPGLAKDQKILAIQKEIEEATSLELPMLEKNLVILATLASVSTLVGLLGTVIGMIKAFAALATAGAPDAVALANGISEALINTALGIGTSALAIIMYNVFTTMIDKMTYGIDEAGFSIIQTYASTHKA